MRTVLVAGGAGFLGSAVVRHLVSQGRRVIALDQPGQAGNSAALNAVVDAPNHRFVLGDVADAALILALLRDEKVEGVLHLAGEGPAGELFSAATQYWRALQDEAKQAFRFHHASNGAPDDGLPAGDHFAMSWHETHGLPVVLSHGADSHGPYQSADSFVARVIVDALAGKAVSVPGRGEAARGWLHVEDHARALERVLTTGTVGESYGIPGGLARTDLQVVETICALLDAWMPLEDEGKRKDLIVFAVDDPGDGYGHPGDATRLKDQLGWAPVYDFETGLAKTVDWYLENRWWWQSPL